MDALCAPGGLSFARVVARGAGQRMTAVPVAMAASIPLSLPAVK